MKIQLFLMILLLVLFLSCDKNKPTNNTGSDSDVTPKVESQFSTNGELIGSSYKTSDGTIIKMTISKTSSPNGHNSEIVFLSGNDTILTLQSGVVRSSEGIGQIFTSANATGVNYRIDIDASNIILEKGKSSTGMASVKVSLGEKIWNGSLDFATSTLSNLEGATRLSDAIPSQTATRISPFVPALQDAFNFYSKQSSGAVLASMPGQPIVLDSVVGSLCRITCAAATVAATIACSALSCGETLGAGCVVCLLAAGAAGQLCQELCPP
jgi:hypothetical protein